MSGLLPALSPTLPLCLGLGSSYFFPSYTTASLVGPVQTTEPGNTPEPPICQSLFIRSRTDSQGLVLRLEPYFPAREKSSRYIKPHQAPFIRAAVKRFWKRRTDWQDESRDPSCSGLAHMELSLPLWQIPAFLPLVPSRGSSGEERRAAGKRDVRILRLDLTAATVSSSERKPGPVGRAC